jgi:ssDNA-binding Zn-finger/Zn-ribbon topoisomerase 1
MPRDRQAAGVCPECNESELVCSYNRFEKDGLRIDSWEHKCANCGARQTRAFRSDDEDRDPALDPAVCPYCGREGQA